MNDLTKVIKQLMLPATLREKAHCVNAYMTAHGLMQERRVLTNICQEARKSPAIKEKLMMYLLHRSLSTLWDIFNDLQIPDDGKCISVGIDAAMTVPAGSTLSPKWSMDLDYALTHAVRVVFRKGHDSELSLFIEFYGKEGVDLNGRCLRGVGSDGKPHSFTFQELNDMYQSGELLIDVECPYAVI